MLRQRRYLIKETGEFLTYGSLIIAETQMGCHPVIGYCDGNEVLKWLYNPLNLAHISLKHTMLPLPLGSIVGIPLRVEVR